MSESSQVESREDPLEEGGDANITVNSDVAASVAKSSCLGEPACTDEEAKRLKLMNVVLLVRELIQKTCQMVLLWRTMENVEL